MKPTSASSLETAPGPASSPERLAPQDLFKAAHDYAHHSLRRLGIPESDRADLVQEALIAASFRLSDYRAERGAPATWLRGFLIKVACNYRRKRRRYQRLLRDESARAPAFAPSPDEGSSPVEEQRRILLEELLPKVPFHQRVVVIARDLDGLSMAVIAEQQALPISTAYHRYQRGRAALDRAYAGWRQKQKDRGLLLLPMGLGQLLEADRTLPEAPSELLDTAIRRVRRARPLSTLQSVLRRPVVKSALTLVSGAVMGASLHAALSKRDPPPPSAIAPLPPILLALAESAQPEAAAGAAPSATVLAAVSSTASPPRARPPAAPPSALSSTAKIGAAPGAENPGDEDHVFDAARRAFDRGDLGAALAALQIHERDFPAGDFAFDRELLRVKVLVKSGRIPEARARLDRLRGSAGGRKLAERLEAFVPGGAPSAAPMR